MGESLGSASESSGATATGAFARQISYPSKKTDSTSAVLCRERTPQLNESQPVPVILKNAATGVPGMRHGTAGHG